MRTPEDLAKEALKNISQHLFSEENDIWDFIDKELLRIILEAQAEVRKEAARELIKSACL